MIISVVNHSVIPTEEVQRVIRAINRQLLEDFQPYWHINATLRLEGSAQAAPAPENPVAMRGDAIIYLSDKVDDDEALGFHNANFKGIPVGFVFTALSQQLGEAWSVTFSHEVLELALDPLVNGYELGPHPTEPHRVVFYWREACDAVQKDCYVIDGVEVSNFVLPHYFTPRDELAPKNDFLGTQLNSLSTNPGGYMGYYDPAADKINYIEDERGKQRRELKNTAQASRRGVRYTDNTKATTANIANTANAEFDGFVVTTSPNDDLLKTLASTVSEFTNNWSVTAVEYSDNDFDVVPNETHEASSQEILQIQAALQNLKEVEVVEACYMELLHDLADDDDAAVYHAADRLSASSSLSTTDLPGTENPLWSVELVKADKAWQKIPSSGKQYGEGICIAHPDSGYRHHYELDPPHDNRLLLNRDWDFVKKDANPETSDGSHGLGTASVIMSGRGGPGSKFVTGIAPRASLSPLRVAKNKWLLPTPVLMFGGMRRLRKAINYAVDTHCHVISISLGGLIKNRSLRNAIDRAKREGVIVLAAAGNGFGGVAYPAKYRNVIAVAACNIKKEAWHRSTQGKQVDVTAPGESVWKAGYKNNRQVVVRRSGTSFAVATTAGVAALWLAYWGRDNLIQHYGSKENMVDGFKQLLIESCNKSHNLPAHGFGAGIVDAEALLSIDIGL